MQNNAQEQLRKTLTDLLGTLKEIQNIGKPEAAQAQNAEKSDGAKYDKREPDGIGKVQRATEAAAKAADVGFILYTATKDHTKSILQVDACQHILSSMICDLLCHEDPHIQAAAKQGVLKAMAIQTGIAA